MLLAPSSYLCGLSGVFWTCRRLRLRRLEPSPDCSHVQFVYPFHTCEPWNHHHHNDYDNSSGVHRVCYARNVEANFCLFRFGHRGTRTGPPIFSITVVSPPTSSATTTTVSANQNGSTTTTKTTVVTAATPQVTTSMLANPPPTSNQTSIQVNIPGFGPTTVSSPVVSFVPQSLSNGVTALNLSVTGTITGPVAAAVVAAGGGSPESPSVPFSLTQTVRTVAAAPVAPQTLSSSTTTLPVSFIFPRGFFSAPAQPDQSAVVDVEEDVRAASDNAQAAISLCAIDKPACVADALDAYADELEKLAPRLPPRLRALPGILRKASHNIRAAKTPAAAVRAVKIAIAEVRKTISLLQADDVATRSVGTREGSLVAATLQVASNKLQKAVGI